MVSTRSTLFAGPFGSAELVPHLKPVKQTQRNQDAAQGLGLAFAPKNRRQLVVRNTAMRLMGLPKVADLVMGRSFRDAVELPTFAAA